MGNEGGNNGLRRREAVGMDKLVEGFIKDMKLAAGLNRQRVIAAWNAVSGAGRYTVDVYMKGKVLHCTIGSSVIRNQLYFQKDMLVERMNGYLSDDDMYIKDDEGPCIEGIVLK